MNKKIPIIITLILLVNIGTVFAGEQGSIGLNYFNSGYQFNDNFQEDISVKEVRGRYKVNNDLAVNAGYNFGDYDNYVQGGLKQFSLGVTKEFIQEIGELTLGLKGNYSTFKTELFNQEMFQVKGKNLELTAGIQREVRDNLKLFADTSYSLAGDYELGTSLLDVGELTGYETGSNYMFESGIKWEAVPDLEIKLGYKLGQQKITNDSFEYLKIQDYDLTKINKLTRGVFFGLESKF